MTEPKDAAAVRVFPPAIPLLTILLGVGLNRVWPIYLGFTPSLAARCWAGGMVVAGAILGLGAWSVMLIRRGGQTENPWSPTMTIVDRGPFSVSRNPLYLQMVVVCIGFAIMLWNAWILLLTPVCAWLLLQLAILPEEEYLERKFGDVYRAYKRRVRRWL